jgi:hypothetical protein
MVCDHCGSDAHVTFFQDCPTEQHGETNETPADETVATETESGMVPAHAPANMVAATATDIVPIVVNPQIAAIVAIVDRLAENGLFLHGGAVPKMENVTFTSSKKDRSIADLHWTNDAVNTENRQLALFANIVDPTDAPSKGRLSWRLSARNALIQQELSAHGNTYGYTDNFHMKLMLTPAPPDFDPHGYYSLDATVDFLKQCDQLVFAQGGKLCTSLISEFKALSGKKPDDTIEKYIEVKRDGDKLLQDGTSSPPHTHRGYIV